LLVCTGALIDFGGEDTGGVSVVAGAGFGATAGAPYIATTNVVCSPVKVPFMTANPTST
jgi:hypothetical protein